MNRILVLAILTSCVFSIYAYDFHVGDFYYRILADEGEAVEIVPLENDSVYAKLSVAEIPEQVSFNDVTYRVIGVGDTAFSYCKNLKAIHLPSSITRIGKLAFNHCVGLKQVTIPSNVHYIGENIFKDCVGLDSVIWNAIDCAAPQRENDGFSPAFWGATNISSFVLGDSVRVIPVGLCYGLTDLKEILFPATVESIGDYAFYLCEQLSTITIPQSVQYMGKNVFGNCTGLRTVVWKAEDCVVPYRYEDESLVLSPIFINDSNIVSFTFADSVQSIPMGLCHNLTHIEHIQLPYMLRNIGSKAFHGIRIKSLILPQNIESIGNDAFEHCDSLHVVEWNTNKYIPAEYETLWSMENRIFGFNAHVRQAIFGDSVQIVPQQSCSALPELRSVVFNGDVLRIEKSAFELCPQLSDVTLPNNLLSLGDYSFSSTGIKEITVHAPCTYIGEGVFSECTKLRQCRFDGINKIGGLDVSWFKGCRDLQIHISDGTIVQWW